MTTIYVDKLPACDGTTDDTAALQASISGDATRMIQSAIDAVSSEDDEVVFSDRTYRVSSTIHLKRCQYRGDNTLIKPYLGKRFDFCFSTDTQVNALFTLSNLENFTLSVMGIALDNGSGGMTRDFVVSR